MLEHARGSAVELPHQDAVRGSAQLQRRGTREGPTGKYAVRGSAKLETRGTRYAVECRSRGRPSKHTAPSLFDASTLQIHLCRAISYTRYICVVGLRFPFFSRRLCNTDPPCFSIRTQKMRPSCKSSGDMVHGSVC